MNNFKKTYDIIMEDIIQSVTPKELEERQSAYAKIQLKSLFDNLVKQNLISKNEDGSYDIKCGICLTDMKLSTLTDIPYELHKINGTFDCSYNNFTNLKGCPIIVNQNFYCSFNKLTSLEGCSQIIGKNFVVSNNKLRSLEGCPKHVKGDFYIKNNFYMTLHDRDIRKVCTVDGKVYV